jgi:hypothetical protein
MDGFKTAISISTRHFKMDKHALSLPGPMGTVDTVWGSSDAEYSTSGARSDGPSLSGRPERSERARFPQASGASSAVAHFLGGLL